MKVVWIFLHLAGLSWQDLREKKISMWPVAELGAVGWVCSLRSGAAVSPWLGIVLLFVSWITEERIGEGDAWLILALGMWLSAAELMVLFFAALVLCMMTGLFLQQRELPFLPFLTAAYVIMEGWK